MAATAIAAGLALPAEAQTVLTASNASSLIAALNTIDSNPNTSYTLNFTQNITLTSATTLPGITSNSMVTINGGNTTLNGSGVQRGFFVYSGTVAVNNLAIQNTVAQGGTGGSGGGGGGLGAGGALFVASGANVTVSNVSLSGNSATGGAGGAGGFGFGGGGGGGLGGGGGGGGFDTGGGGGGFSGGGGGAGGTSGSPGGAGPGGAGGNGGAAGAAGGNGVNGGAGGTGSPAEVDPPFPPLSAATGGGGGGGGLGGGNGGAGTPGPRGGNGGGGGGGGLFTNSGGNGGTGGIIPSNGGTGGVGGGGGGGNTAAIFGGGAGGAFGGAGGADAGGVGGFGGGGGGAINLTGGNGGFGGGGGGTLSNGGIGTGGAGGFAAGSGALGGVETGFGSPGQGGGGGGAGLGGAVFVQQGGGLTIAGAFSVNGSAVTGGVGGTGGPGAQTGGDGQAFGSGLFLQGNGTLTFAPGNAQSQTISDIIADQTGSGGTGANAGSWSLIKSGAGTLTLSGADTYTGGTALNAGTLTVGNNSALGSGSLSMAAGTTLSWASGRNFTLANNITIAGDPNFAPPAGTTQTIGGVISDGAAPGTLNMLGPGTLLLAAANTYTGPTNVQAGTLALGAGGSIANSSGVNLAASGTSFDISGGGNQTIKDLSGAAGSQVALGGNTLTLGTANSTTFAGAITGSGGITKQGSGTLTLNGNNTYAGATTIAGGTVALSGVFVSLTDSSGVNLTAAGATFDVSATGFTTIQGLSGVAGTSVKMGDGDFLAVNQTGRSTFAGAIAGGGFFIDQGTGTLTLTGASTFRGVVEVTGGGTLGIGNNSALGNAVLELANGSTLQAAASGLTVPNPVLLTGAETVDTQTNALTLSGDIGGLGSLTKIGTGTLTLSGNNNYMGETIISSGTLALGGFGSIADSSGVNLTAAGATFDISGSTTTVQSLIGVAGSVVNLTNGNQGSFLFLNQTGTSTFAGAFTGGSASYLVFLGPGTQILTGVSTETGYIDLRSGTLAVGPGGSIASNGAMLVEGGGRFDISNGGNQTVQNLFANVGASITLGANTLTIVDTPTTENSIAGVISGTGGLTLQGSGTVLLDAANTYTGATTVSGVTLGLGPPGFASASIAGPVGVAGGATLFGLGTIGGTLTNTGTVMPGGGLTNTGALTPAVGTLTVGGNYTQSSSGTLTIAVTPTAASKLAVGGAANLAGTLALNFAPGTYTLGTSYTLLTASSLTGTFSTVTGTNPSGQPQTILYEGDPSVVLQLGFGGTVAPTNDTIYSAATSIAVMNAQEVNSIILDRIGQRQAGIADGQIAVLAQGGLSGVQLAQAGGNGAAFGELPEALSSQGAWFRGIGGFASVDGNSTAPGFTGATGGFLAGYDRAVAPNMYLGIAGGYLHSNIDEHSTSNGTEGSLRLNVYGGALAGPSLFSATAGYANDRFVTNRGIAGIGTASENHPGNEGTAAGQWSLPLTIPGYGGGAATLTPKAGIQYLYLSEGAFSETGAGGFDLSNAGHGTSSLQPFAGAVLAQKFMVDGGTEITPELRLGYAHELFDSRLLTVTVSGASFPVEGVRPSRDQLTAGFGVVMQAAPNLSAYADYDTILHTGNTTEQVVEAGLRIRF